MKKLIVFTLFVSLCLWNAGASLAADWSDGADGYIYYTSGKVGIGTSSPIVPYKFSVISNLGGVEIGQPSYIEGASNVFEPNYPTLSVKRSSGSNGATIAIGNSDGQFYLNGTEFNLRVYNPFEEEVFRVSSAGDIDFKGNLYQNGVLINLDSSGTEESKWSDGTGGIYYNSGNVGIGTVTPGYKLDVNGDINFTGNLFKNGIPFEDESSIWTESGGSISYSSNVNIDGDISTGGVYKIGKNTVLSTIGTANIFVGDNAGNSYNPGSYNTFIGKDAGHMNSGGNNTFVGRMAGEINTVGYENTFIGNYAGKDNETGKKNTFIGFCAGCGTTGGEKNTFIGIGTGDGNEGSGNIFLGYNAGLSENGSNKLYIANSGTTDPLIYGEFDNNLLQVNGDLKVDGTITTKEVLVTAEGWPDYVFKNDHKLMPLDELEQSIKKNGHLPDIPSAEEVKKNGVSVGEMQASLLRKVEELTLYMIQLKKENEILKKQIATLQIN